MTPYPILRDIHALFSQIGLIFGILMFAAGVYIGLIRHGDVTRVFRYGVFGMIAFMGVEALFGLGMVALGGRPAQEVHFIYGAGAVLALPFFAYVEMTAKKRPAMGSYIWGFGLMAAIILRTMSTGAM